MNQEKSNVGVVVCECQLCEVGEGGYSVLVTAEKSKRVRASLNEQEDQSQSLN